MVIQLIMVIQASVCMVSITWYLSHDLLPSGFCSASEAHPGLRPEAPLHSHLCKWPLCLVEQSTDSVWFSTCLQANATQSHLQHLCSFLPTGLQKMRLLWPFLSHSDTLAESPGCLSDSQMPFSHMRTHAKRQKSTRNACRLAVCRLLRYSPFLFCSTTGFLHLKSYLWPDKQGLGWGASKKVTFKAGQQSPNFSTWPFLWFFQFDPSSRPSGWTSPHARSPLPTPYTLHTLTGQLSQQVAPCLHPAFRQYCPSACT